MDAGVTEQDLAGLPARAVAAFAWRCALRVHALLAPAQWQAIERAFGPAHRWLFDVADDAASAEEAGDSARAALATGSQFPLSYATHAVGAAANATAAAAAGDLEQAMTSARLAARASENAAGSRDAVRAAVVFDLGQLRRRARGPGRGDLSDLGPVWPNAPPQR